MKFHNAPQLRYPNEEKREGGASQETLRVELPMDAAREAFIESVKQRESTILIGETGSGKTTRGPVFLLDAFPKARIACTSPRVLPALSVSEYIAEGRGGVVGDEVGIITRQEKKVGDDTRLIFMTDGVLLSAFRRDPLLLEYDIVMVDEAHERSLNIDLSLGLLKEAQQKRKEQGEKELKIVIASATIEEQKFADYFEVEEPLKVPGRMYPVDVTYVPLMKDLEGNEEYEEDAAARLAKKLLTKGEGDILIFMPGEEEIKRTIENISRELGDGEDVEVLPLYASMHKDDQKKAFAKNGLRKIIVSTNIAETSVTIPGVRYVIDTGTVKQKNYNPDTGINELKLIKTSQANMNQRKGRAGRTAPGECYRLMSKEEFESRQAFQLPEIERENLEETVLRMKDMGIDDVETFPFIDKPSSKRLHDAVTQLQKLGALDATGRITEVGKEMSHFEMRPDIARMLLEAKKLGCLPTMVDLCPLISSSKNILIRGNPERAKTYEEAIAIETKMANQERLRIGNSDLLTILNVWDKWVASGYNHTFAFDHFLNIPALRDIGQARSQLLKNLALQGIEIRKREGDIDSRNLLKALLAGAPEALFYTTDGYGVRGGKKYYPFNDDPALQGAKIFPGSSLFKQESTLLFSLDVSRSEKQDTDRFSGQKVMRSNLWAKMCHKLTYEDMEALIPGSVVEKQESEPTYSPYSGEYEQSFGIYVLGRRIDQKRVIVKDYEPSESRIFRVDRFGTSVHYDISPISIRRILPDIHHENERVVEKINDYILRSGGLLPIASGKEEYLRNIFPFYEKVINDNTITTEEDIKRHPDRFMLSISDFVLPEDLHQVEMDSPHEIDIGEHVYDVIYKKDSDEKSYAYIELYNDSDIEEVLDNEIPQFPRMKGVGFLYDNKYLKDKESLLRERDTKVRLRDEALQVLQMMQVDKKRKEKIEKPEVVAVPEKQKLQKQEVTHELLDQLTETITNGRAILAYLRGVAEKRNEKEWKDKSNTLLRIKELLGKCTSFSKDVEEGAQGLTVDMVTSRKADLLQSITKVAKRVGIEEKADIMVEQYTKNKNMLMDALKRNDVEPTDSLIKKIETKVNQLSFEEGKELTNEEADDIIIELL